MLFAATALDRAGSEYGCRIYCSIDWRRQSSE
jgi:hypothetical protein